LRRGTRLRGGSNVELLSLGAGQDPPAVAARLASDPAVEFAEPNYLITADQGGSGDPRFAEQWALHAAEPAFGIGAEKAWGRTTGSTATVIAVVDSGIDFAHPDLRGNEWVNAAERRDGRDEDRDGFPDDVRGWDWVAGTGEVRDGLGHGTAVAGLIAARGDNGVGVSGVMWRASLMSLRVLDSSGTGDVASAVEAIDYAAAHGAHVINCSWGADNHSRALLEAVARAGKGGALFVASAGNSGSNVDAQPRYPASYDLPNVIGVTATDRYGELTPTANWGAARVGLAAPGEGLLTTAPGGGYQELSGTSASAALVSGVAGLVKSLRPRLGAARVRGALIGGAHALPSLAGKISSGALADALGALDDLDTSPAGGGKGDGDEAGDDGQPAKDQTAAPSGVGSADGAPGAGAGLPSREPVRGRPAPNLPDLDAVRRHRPTRPQAPAPVPSTLRNCPPHNPNCNGGPAGAVTPGPTPVAANGAATGPIYLASARRDAAWRPAVVTRLSLLDYLREGAVSDASAGPFADPRSLFQAGGALPSLFPALLQTAYGAQFISQSVPAQMTTGQTYSVSVTMKNTGTNTWSPESYYRLGAQNPQDVSVWRMGRVDLPASVPPGATVTIPFTVTAPTTGGAYNFQWQMVHDGVTWFGDLTANVQVQVVAPQFQGYLDWANCDTIGGWALDWTRPNTPIEVDIYADGNYVTRAVADIYRADLVAAGMGDGRHGFSLPVPPELRNNSQRTITARPANTLALATAPPWITGSHQITCGPVNTPYGGATHQIPGTVEAEYFDDGGQGVGYYDTTPGTHGQNYNVPGNPPPTFRQPTDVDIYESAGYSNNYLVLSQAGDWTKYTVDVAAAGSYTMLMRIAWGGGPGGTFHVEFDGVDKTGPIQIPDTGWALQTTSRAGVQLTSGRHVMRVVSDANGAYGYTGDIDYLAFQREGGAQTPYAGSSIPVPGTIEAEAYDNGGEGVAYHDTTAGNHGVNYNVGGYPPSTYRSPTDVDVYEHSSYSGGYLVLSQAGDWTEYSVRVAATGSYKLLARVMWGGAGGTLGTFHVEIDGVDKTGPMQIPDTSWGSWQTVSKTGIQLTAGQHVVRIVSDANAGNGYTGDIDYVSFIDEKGAGGDSMARLEPRNRTGVPGVDLLSGNFNWGLPLVSLPGRSGLDLGLSLAYNSLVWTKIGTSTVQFNSDNGSPAAGFRLGFPAVQRRYYNGQAQKFAYLLVAPSGARVELREAGTPNVYESADSSYLRLVDNGASMVLTNTDGTRMTFRPSGGEYVCTEVKDSNGNFITVAYDWQGGIDTITDTLGRVVTFNYDANHNLVTITQRRGGRTHALATFGYGALTVQHGFAAGVMVLGPQNGQQINVLTQVGLPDGSRYGFEYTPRGQVSKLTRYSAENHELARTTYAFSPTTEDCPKVSERRDWALDWNNGAEAVTAYAYAGDYSGGQATAPDGTVYKELFATSGWQAGLATVTQAQVGGVTQKETVAEWAQDDMTLAYQLNPRVTATQINDAAGNRRRTSVQYYTPAELNQEFGLSLAYNFGLVKNVFEYKADAATVLRSTQVKYNLAAPYVNQRLIGLVSERSVYEGDVTAGGTLAARTTYSYDQTDEGRLAATLAVDGTPVNPTQHDGAYGTGFSTRGNVTSVVRHRVKDDPTPVSVVTKIGYNTAGSVTFSIDPEGHRSEVGYADSFSDGVNRNAFAYPTSMTDPDQVGGQSPQRSYAKYHYDTGAASRVEGLSPNEGQAPPAQTFAYDAAGRLVRVTDLVTNAYTRHVYSSGQTWVQTFTTVRDLSTEAYSIQVFDGAGRAYASASDFPNSTGHYRAQHTVFDAAGRAVRASNPTEVTAAWEPSGDDAAGWRYATQDYDWKGRPTYSTAADGTFTQELIYGGCGCAGGVTVTARDGVGRRQKSYHDVLGRVVKTEVYNGINVYSSTTTRYDALDRVTRARSYAGPAPAPDDEPTAPDWDPATGGVRYQTSLFEYDGHGRLARSHAPAQRDQYDPVKWTSYAYDGDDVARSVTDARDVVTTFGFTNARHLVNAVTYSNAPAGVPVPSPVTFTYDAAGNRKSMNDPQGSTTYAYDQLSRLQSEVRYVAALGQSYTLSYAYTPGGQLLSMTGPFGAQFDYGYDAVGRLEQVSGAAYAGVTTYASAVRYRAWGAVKSASFGNGSSQTTGYDARLRPKEFRLTGGTYVAPVREDYSYYADGRLQSLTDLDDRVGDNPPLSWRFMSRSFNYDHAGRVTGAVGSGQAYTPYNQSYGYDEFGNLTSRSGKYWYQPTQSDAATYTNGRRDGWAYDADGRLTQSPGNPSSRARWWTHDAAGRQTKVEEDAGSGTRNHQQAGYDGDGLAVYEASWGPAAPTAAHHLLRSTALGGEVVARIDSAGNHKYTYVPAGGLLSARQAKDYNNQPAVEWTFRDPVGLTETGRDYGAYDPLGNFAAYENHPPIGPPPGLTGMFGPSYNYIGRFYNDANNYSTGCLLDGRPASCDAVVHSLVDGRAKREVPLAPPGVKIEFNPMPMGSPGGGMVPFYVPGGQRVGSRSGYGGSTTGPDGEEIEIVNHTVTPGGYWIQVPSLGFLPGAGYAYAGYSPEPENSEAPSGRTISNTVKGVCSISVSFEGPIGNKDRQGIGFTVSGYVRFGKIGRVGDGSDPAVGENGGRLPGGGNWQIGQTVQSSVKQSYGFNIVEPDYFYTAPKDDSPRPRFRTVGRNVFSWHDTPGFMSSNGFSKLEYGDGRWNFTAYVRNRNRGCEVRFHMKATFSNGIISSWDWGPGHYDK
jgi:YD repeat-containing protein